MATMIPSPRLILETADDALRAAEQQGESWPDRLWWSLKLIDIEVDDMASAEADPDGHGPLAVLTDGRQILKQRGHLSLIDDTGAVLGRLWRDRYLPQLNAFEGLI